MTKRTGKKTSRSKQSEADGVENFTLSSPEAEKTPEQEVQANAQTIVGVAEETVAQVEEIVSTTQVASDETVEEQNAGEESPTETEETAEETTEETKAGETNEAQENEQEEEPMLSAGALLKQARDAAGLTIDSVAVSLKLAPRQIVALENNEYEKLPARTFVRGFVRNYARLLNTDPDTILAALPPEPQEEISPAAISVKRPTSAMPSLPTDSDFPRTQRKIWRWLIALIILALFFIVLLFKPKIETWLKDLQKTAAPETVQEEIMPQTMDPTEQALPPSAVILLGEEPTSPEASPLVMSPETTETPSAAAVPDVTQSPATALNPPLMAATNGSAQPLPGDAELEMIFDDQSWTEVRDANNKSLFIGLAQAGEQKKLYGKAPLTVVLGKGEVVRMTFRGQPVDLKTASPGGGVTRITLG